MTNDIPCPLCGSPAARWVHPVEYLYEHSGLANVTLAGGVDICHCRKCGHETTRVVRSLQLLQTLALDIVLAPAGLTGEELRFLRGEFELTQAALARAMGLPRRETIAEWEARDRVFASPSAEVAPRLVLLRLFRTHVFERDPCLLSAAQRQAYDRHIATFVDRIDVFLRGDGERGPRIMRFSREGKTWTAEKVTV